MWSWIAAWFSKSRRARQRKGAFAAMQEGDVVTGTVRSLMSYGAFIDIGGVDGLLHVSDMAWGRVNKPEDVVTVGQEIRVRILKIDPETKKISLGLKQLQPEPWETAPENMQVGPADHRHGNAPCGFRRVCRDRAGHRRADSHLGDVVGQKGAPPQRRCQARRPRGRGDSRHQAGGDGGSRSGSNRRLPIRGRRLRGSFQSVRRSRGR